MEKYPEYPVIPLTEEEVEALKEGNPTQQEIYRAIQEGNPEIAIKAFAKMLKIRQFSFDIEHYITQTLAAKRIRGPFHLEGAASLAARVWQPEELLGGPIAELSKKDKPLPWLRFGSSRYFGDFYMASSGMANVWQAEDLPFRFAEIPEKLQKKHDQVLSEILGRGWFNDIRDIIHFQVQAAQLGIESEDEFEDHLEEIGAFIAEPCGSLANIKRYLESRWFNFSAKEVKKILEGARPVLAELKKK